MNAAKLKVTETDLDDFIPLAEAARMLGLSSSSLRKRKAGTATLTLIAQGKKLFMIRGEIIAHRRKLVDDARQRTNILRIVGQAQ